VAYLRLFRRVRLLPGVSLNLSTRGPSLSLGVRGAHLTVGRSGIRRTVGLPGTGLFFTARDGWHSGIHSAREFHEGAPAPQGTQPTGSDVLLGVLVVLAVLGIIVGLVAIVWH
jgi:hypothetical protein